MTEANAGNSWRIAEPPPTIALVGWGSDDQPVCDDVMGRVRHAVGELQVGPAATDTSADMVWGRPVRVGAAAEPMGIWAQPGISFPAAELGGQPAPKSARWCVGIQAIARADQPYEWYAKLLRWAREAFNDLVYVADPLSGAVWGPDDLSGILAGPMLPDGVLWSTQTARATLRGKESAAWVHTAGLARFSRPELEMLEVPAHLIWAATFLLDELADRFIYEPLPAPGTPIPVGGESRDRMHWVVVKPWEEVIGALPAGAPGQREHRAAMGDPGVFAVSAVVCALNSERVTRSWSCPIDVLEKVRGGSISILQSDLAMNRRGILARYGWPELALAFHDWQQRPNKQEPAAARFFLMTSLPAPGAEPDGVESLTVEIEGIDGDLAVGRATHDGHWNQSIRRGNSIEVSCNAVTDWFVETPRGRIGAQHRGAVRQTVANLVAATDRTSR